MGIGVGEGSAGLERHAAVFRLCRFRCKLSATKGIMIITSQLNLVFLHVYICGISIL